MYPLIGKGTIDIVSYYGSIASLLGILFTLIEVIITERITRSTQEEVKKKMNEIENVHMNVSITETINQCDFLRINLEHDELNDALKEGRALRDSLTKLKVNKKVFSTQEHQSSYSKYSTRLSMDIDSLIRVLDLGASFDKSSMIINVQNIRQLLVEIESLFRIENYGLQ